MLLLKFLAISGPCIFFYLLISTIQTVLNIWRDKTVKTLSCFPFVSLFINCLVWAIYGLFLSDNAVFVPNVVGAIVGILATFVYQSFSSSVPWVQYGGAFAILLLTIHFVVVQDGESIGLIGCVLSVMLSASPLAVIKTVIIEKSTASLPFGTSLALFLCGMSWTLYGLLLNNPILIVPNMLGAFLSGLQMCLFAYYGIQTSDDKDTSSAGLSSKVLLI